MKKHVTLVVIISSAMTVAAYWQGLGGPLLYDDEINLKAVDLYFQGKTDLEGAVFGAAGPLGRPVSMLSFLANRWACGPDIACLKLTNVLIHLVCGFVLFVFLRMWLGESRQRIAAGIVVIWLVLPIHVSSVLYVVQRMAQLSALFLALALVFYLQFRQSIVAGRPARAVFALMGLAVAFTLSMFSKENGVVLILLIPLVELVRFQTAGPLPQQLRRIAYSVFVATAFFLVAFSIWALQSDWLERAYAARPFTLEERLLTQPRVLWQYIVSAISPASPTLGLFNDDFPVSTGLINPPSTLIAILGWLIALVWAAMAYARTRLMLAGVLFYLACHSLESSYFSLIMYFEHRNYLASIGLLLWVVGLYEWLKSFGLFRDVGKRAMVVLPSIAVVVYAFATYTQAWVWGKEDRLYAQALTHHPQSARLRGELAFKAILKGDTAQALEHIAVLERVSPEAERMTVTLWKFLAYCETDMIAPASIGTDILRLAEAPMTNIGRNALARIADLTQQGKCRGFDPMVFARGAAMWLDQTSTPLSVADKMPYRYAISVVFAAYGKYESARQLLEHVREMDPPLSPAAIMLFRVYVTLEMTDEAREWLSVMVRYKTELGPEFARNVTAFDQFMESKPVTN